MKATLEERMGAAHEAIASAVANVGDQGEGIKETVARLSAGLAGEEGARQEMEKRIVSQVENGLAAVASSEKVQVLASQLETVAAQPYHLSAPIPNVRKPTAKEMK